MYGETLTLYRGDFQKIKDFDLKKTYKHCLYGQGIYLTTDPSVANTYRTKGANINFRKIPLSGILFEGSAKNKTGAMNKAFEKFVLYMVDDKGKIDLSGKIKPTLNNKTKGDEKYTEAVSKINSRKMLAAKSHWFDVQDELVVTRIPRVLTGVICKSNDFIFKIFWPRVVQKVGHVTHFEFPRLELERNTLSVDESIKSLGLEELFPDYYPHRNLNDIMRVGGLSKMNLRQTFQPWGYLGITRIPEVW